MIKTPENLGFFGEVAFRCKTGFQDLGKMAADSDKRAEYANDSKLTKEWVRLCYNVAYGITLALAIPLIPTVAISFVSAKKARRGLKEILGQGHSKKLTELEEPTEE